MVVPPTAAARARIKCELSQAEFATLLALSKRTIEQWEQGRRQQASLKNILKSYKVPSDKVSNGKNQRKNWTGKEEEAKKYQESFLRAPMKSAHQPTLRQEMPKKDLEKEKHHGYQ